MSTFRWSHVHISGKYKLKSLLLFMFACFADHLCNTSHKLMNAALLLLELCIFFFPQTYLAAYSGGCLNVLCHFLFASGFGFSFVLLFIPLLEPYFADLLNRSFFFFLFSNQIVHTAC